MLYLMFALGLILLFVGGDLLVRGSVALAQKMGVSPLLIGIVLVGFGTSTPELLASFLAAMDGVSGIAVGNVVGSNICNILLVLGVGAVICPVVIDKKSFKRDGGFLIISVLGLSRCRFVLSCGSIMASQCHVTKDVMSKRSASVVDTKWALRTRPRWIASVVFPTLV